jgi:tetratricopeptide (TPR) repeat protein
MNHSTIVRLYNCLNIQPLSLIVGRTVCGILLWLFAASPGFAQSDSQFAKANQEYAAGHFKEAIAEYAALVQKREYSTNLFYDLGNAFFRAGDFGKAILNYERTLALDRHHPEAAANLQIARDDARALELPQSGLDRLLKFGTLNQYAIVGAVAFWLSAFCLIGLIFARRRSAGVIALSIFSLSIFALATAAIFWIDNGSKGRALAIVTGSGVEARLATADSANSVLALPTGSQVRILSKRGDWIYAALPNNLRGWIPATSAEAVRL